MKDIADSKRTRVILLKAVILNLFYMLLTVLLFEQFATYDDYTMAVQFAGGIGDSYAGGQTFVNPLYGEIIFALNKWLPRVPWFNIILFLAQFLGLILITEMILEYHQGMIGNIVCHLILLFFSYEAYAGTCFTKVAGIIAGCSLSYLLYEKKHYLQKMIAWILLGTAVLLRNQMVIMICGITVVFLIYIMFREIVVNKKKIGKQLFLRNGIILMTCMILYVGLSKESLWFDVNTCANFEQQLDENSVRSQFQDYPIPAYEENKDAYARIGLSENDIHLFRQWNYDRHKLTETIYDVIDTDSDGNIITKALSFENITSFFKSYPKNLLDMDVVYCLLGVMALLLLSCRREKRKRFWIRCGFVTLFNLGLMYYFFISGRYNQHRVDIAVELALILGMITLCDETEFSQIYLYEKKRVIMLWSVLAFSLVPYTFHDDFHWGAISDYHKEELVAFDDYMVEDKEHFYLLTYTGNDIDIFKMYSLWGVTRENYKDRYTNTSMVANFYDDDYIVEYGIHDLYLDAVDSDTIRVVLSENNPDLSRWEKYFEERCGHKVKMKLVREGQGKRVYRVMNAC